MTATPQDNGEQHSSVTALLPAWRAAAFIQPTLDSLSAQTYDNFTVLISVDLCDDGTAALCHAHAARDPRFTVIEQSTRLGYAGNCNALLELACSDYAVFTFHDDTVAPSYIERLVEGLDGDPEAVVSFSDVLLTNTNGSRELWQFTALEGVVDPVRRGMTMLDAEQKWWVPNRGLFRLDRVRQIGGVKTHGAGEYSADWPWLFHMSLLGKLVRVPETLCFKFYTSQSLSQTWSHSREQLLHVFAACLRELWNSSLTLEQKLAIAQPFTHYLYQLHENPQAPGATDAATGRPLRG